MKPNQPTQSQSGCKSGKCKPRKETVRLHKAELEQCGGKKVAKVEIPESKFVKIDLEKGVITPVPRHVGQQYHCLSSPLPWEPKGLTPRIPDGVWTEDYHEKEPRNIWKWIAIILFLLLAFVTLLLSYKIEQLNEVIDFQQQLFEELEKAELPQGNGEIQSPGNLPPEGWIDPNTIIRLDRKITMDQIASTAILELEATHEF